MNITLTGSIGNIGKPLTKQLVAKGHSVTVISHNPERQKDIEALGGKAAIGTVEDADFLTRTFTGADVVYLMEAPGNFADPDFDLMAHINELAHNFVQAVKASGVKRVVHLSSIGAHTDKGNGILAFHYNMEQLLNTLPADVSITFMRPVGFYYNMLAFINGIKTQGVMASNYGGDDMLPWVSPIDIADAITEEIEGSFTGRKVRYVASEEISCNEIAGILGEAIGMPDLKWIIIPNEQILAGMKSFGMNPKIAEGLVEMNAAQHDGSLFEDYYRNRPALGKVKVKDFAKDFAAAFHQK